MADDFLNTTSTRQPKPTSTQHTAQSSCQRFDLGDRKIRTTISKVRKGEVKDRETGETKPKLLVFFEVDRQGTGSQRHQQERVGRRSRQTAVGWIGASVGILNDPNVTFAGKRTGGLRLKFLAPPAKPAAAASTSKPATAATPPWSDEKDDPGFDPDFNDPVPDLTTAE